MPDEQKSGSLAWALVEAQAKMPSVDKNGENPHFKSRFVTLDDLIEATRPVLNEHGLAINQFPSVNELGQPVLVTRITHRSGESVEYAMPLLVGNQSMQGLGAAITYARRFAWAAALGVASDTDDDGDSASPPAPAAGEAKPISDAQRRRLFAVAKEHGVDQATVRAYVKQFTGSESTASITSANYDEIVAAVEHDASVPF